MKREEEKKRRGGGKCGIVAEKKNFDRGEKREIEGKEAANDDSIQYTARGSERMVSVGSLT